MNRSVESRGSRVEVRETSGSRPATRDPRPARPAFTLIELLVVMAILGMLAMLLLPTLGRSKDSAKRIQCVSNLRQLGIATQLYWDDNEGRCFRWAGSTNTGQILWFGWLGPGPEGQRPFDATQGKLYPYLQGRGVEICPSLIPLLTQMKLKANCLAYGYGYNKYLSPDALSQPTKKISAVPRPNAIALYADAAQVNDFQAPASPGNPMLEEFFYVNVNTNYSSPNNYPNGHFRHLQKANVVFCDSHVDFEKPLPGSIDPRLPGQFVGQLRPEILLLR